MTKKVPIRQLATGVPGLHRDSMVRKIEVKKMRGQAQLPGLHTFHITDAGVQAFPRVIVGASPEHGTPALDEMLGGGLPRGFSLLVAGPAGCGKTILATAFLQVDLDIDATEFQGLLGGQPRLARG